MLHTHDAMQHVVNLKLERLTEVTIMERGDLPPRTGTRPAPPVTLRTRPVLSWLDADASPSLKAPFFSPHFCNERLSFRRAMLTVQVTVFFPSLLSAAIIDAAVLMEWGECPWSVCPLSGMLLCWRGRGRVAGLALWPQLWHCSSKWHRREGPCAECVAVWSSVVVCPD